MGKFEKGSAGRLRHGHSFKGMETAEYRAWCHMRSRCNNPNTPDWMNYGGRGIRVCSRWDVFENFLADMGPRPPNTSIDRVDNSGDYEPTNCRWSVRKHQNRNKRSNKLKLDDVLYILSSDERGIDLAARFGVSKVTISAIRKRRIWKDLSR